MSDIEDADTYWEFISTRFAHEHENVVPGKMMSADALTYEGKVFVFNSKKGGRIGLGCKVGREFDISSLHLTDWQYLAPFKTRPPMKDWIVVGLRDADRWHELTEVAHKIAQEGTR